MKKSIILMFICAFALMFSSCGQNSGTSHLSQKEKTMKKHLVSYLKDKVGSYDSVVIRYAEKTDEHFRHSIIEDLPCPSCKNVVKIIYCKNNNANTMFLEYTHIEIVDELFIMPLEVKYYWMLEDGVMDWKVLWMEEK